MPAGRTVSEGELPAHVRARASYGPELSELSAQAAMRGLCGGRLNPASRPESLGLGLPHEARGQGGEDGGGQPVEAVWELD